MSEHEAPPTLFNGEDSYGSGQFLRVVRQNAIEKDKTDDDKWTAYFASSRMDGPALEWFEAQPEDVQESWKLLRRALMIRWPPSVQQGVNGPVTPPASPLDKSKIPTAAAAAPAPSKLTGVPSKSVSPTGTSQPTFGRLRACDMEGNPLGYLAKYFNQAGDSVITRPLETLQWCSSSHRLLLRRSSFATTHQSQRVSSWGGVEQMEALVAAAISIPVHWIT